MIFKDLNLTEPESTALKSLADTPLSTGIEKIFAFAEKSCIEMCAVQPTDHRYWQGKTTMAREMRILFGKVANQKPEEILEPDEAVMAFRPPRGGRYSDGF